MLKERMMWNEKKKTFNKPSGSFLLVELYAMAEAVPILTVTLTLSDDVHEPFELHRTWTRVD